MTADECRGWREQLGAFVLGHLDRDEHAAVAAHLERCPDCRAELALLEPMATLLPLADPAHLDMPPAPRPELGRALARRIASEGKLRRRRRLRWGFSVAAAAAGAAAIAVAVFPLGGGRAPGQHVEFTGLPPSLTIGARLTPQPWGSEISVYVDGVRPGARCVVWLRRADGTRVAAGSFRYRQGSSETLTAAIRPQAATRIAVRAGHRTFTARVPHDTT
jgi:hypothetical protein